MKEYREFIFKEDKNKKRLRKLKKE